MNGIKVLSGLLVIFMVVKMSSEHHTGKSVAVKLDMDRRLALNLATLLEALAIDVVEYTGPYTSTVLGVEMTGLIQDKKSLGSQYVIYELNHDDYQLKSLSAVLRPGDTVLDLGTNEGLTAILIAKMYPFVKVIGVEPAPHNWHVAKHNIRANGLEDRVTVLHAALCSSVDIPAEIIYSRKNTAASSTSEEFIERDNSADDGFHYMIQCVTVDEIIERYGLKETPFVKLDCEGCEYDIVPALSPSARAMFMRGYVVGEVHADRITVPKSIELITHSIYYKHDSAGPEKERLSKPGAPITGRIRPQ